MKIIQALRIVFGENGGINFVYIFLFLFFALSFIFFFIELQVLLTAEPDNLSLYLKIWRIKDWLIVSLLSILVSLNFVFFVYLIKIKSPEIKSTSTGILGTLSGIFSAILATALCSSCLAVLFSLLGISFSTGVFFLKYKFLILIISKILLLVSLYFQSKRIIERCQC
jgi:hypothetical protein